ncbi:hypothetical protein D3C78_1493420 [compost metagenome]
MVAVDQIQVDGFEKPFQQQDRPAPARLAAAHGFVQIQHGQALRLGKPRYGLLDTVAVGVGLDDRPDGGRQPRRGLRGLFKVAVHGGKIVRKRGNGDGGGYGARHGVRSCGA